MTTFEFVAAGVAGCAAVLLLLVVWAWLER